MAATGRITRNGPFLEIAIHNVSQWQAWQSKMEAQGGAVPAPPVTGAAIIDTGASLTMIDRLAFDALRPMNAGTIEVAGLQPEAVPWKVQRPGNVRAAQVEIRIAGILRPFTLTVGVYPLHLAYGSEVVALIGRDVLDQLTLSYDGPGRKITLS